MRLESLCALGYGIVQFKCDGTRLGTGGEVQKVAMYL